MSTAETTETDIEALYDWSTWLHVGKGAESCEDVDESTGENTCSNPLHFHAFCRLPNPYEHRGIRERALAAKARRVRLYADPDSDPSVILDGQLDTLARKGDLARAALIDELLVKDWWRDYLEATQTVQAREGENGVRPFEHIEADIERYEEMAAAEEPDESAMAELNGHIEEWNRAVEQQQKEIEAPRREAYEAMDVSALVAQVRDLRVDVDSNESFTHEYAACEQLACTLRQPEGEPVFASREQMERARTAVVEGLKETFGDLERTRTKARESRGGGPGNS